MSESQMRDFEELRKELQRIREEAEDTLATRLVAIEVTLARLVAAAT